MTFDRPETNAEISTGYALEAGEDISIHDNVLAALRHLHRLSKMGRDERLKIFMQQLRGQGVPVTTIDSDRNGLIIVGAEDRRVHLIGDNDYYGIIDLERGDFGQWNEGEFIRDRSDTPTSETSETPTGESYSVYLSRTGVLIATVTPAGGDLPFIPYLCRVSASASPALFYTSALKVADLIWDNGKACKIAAIRWTSKYGMILRFDNGEQIEASYVTDRLHPYRHAPHRV